jgi:gas vesicle protein
MLMRHSKFCITAIAAVLAFSFSFQPKPAEAGSRGFIAGAIVGGVVGAIVSNQAAASRQVHTQRAATTKRKAPAKTQSGEEAQAKAVPAAEPQNASLQTTSATATESGAFSVGAPN